MVSPYTRPDWTLNNFFLCVLERLRYLPSLPTINLTGQNQTLGVNLDSYPCAPWLPCMLIRFLWVCQTLNPTGYNALKILSSCSAVFPTTNSLIHVRPAPSATLAPVEFRVKCQFACLTYNALKSNTAPYLNYDLLLYSLFDAWFHQTLVDYLNYGGPHASNAPVPVERNWLQIYIRRSN